MIADLAHQAPGGAGPALEPHHWSDASATAAWLASGDESAAAWLVKTHGPIVSRIAKSRLSGFDGAEDAVQSTWFAVFRALAHYDAARPFPAWLARIALNECRDAIRARARRRVFSVSDLGLERIDDLPGVPSSVSPDTDRMAAEREAGAFQLLASLPARDRVAFSLFYGENLSSAEVAARIGIRPGHVRLRIFRAHQILRRRGLAHSVS